MFVSFLLQVMLVHGMHQSVEAESSLHSDRKEGFCASQYQLMHRSERDGGRQEKGGRGVLEWAECRAVPGADEF